MVYVKSGVKRLVRMERIEGMNGGEICWYDILFISDAF